jgi:flagellar hook-associated protein FlgK
MVLYQQAYSAGARVLTTANQLFTTLLQIPSS